MVNRRLAAILEKKAEEVLNHSLKGHGFWIRTNQPYEDRIVCTVQYPEDMHCKAIIFDACTKNVLSIKEEAHKTGHVRAVPI